MTDYNKTTHIRLIQKKSLLVYPLSHPFLRQTGQPACSGPNACDEALGQLASRSVPEDHRRRLGTGFTTEGIVRLASAEQVTQVDQSPPDGEGKRKRRRFRAVPSNWATPKHPLRYRRVRPLCIRRSIEYWAIPQQGHQRGLPGHQTGRHRPDDPNRWSRERHRPSYQYLMLFFKEEEYLHWFRRASGHQSALVKPHWVTAEEITALPFPARKPARLVYRRQQGYTPVSWRQRRKMTLSNAGCNWRAGTHQFYCRFGIIPVRSVRLPAPVFNDAAGCAGRIPGAVEWVSGYCPGDYYCDYRVSDLWFVTSAKGTCP